MSYTLQDFCAEIHEILKAENNAAGREKVRQKLQTLLQNETFIEMFCGPDKKPGVYMLNQDPTTGACVLAHVMEEAHASPPHDHGTSWAIYGQAAGETVMTEFDRTDDGSEPEKFELEEKNRYTMKKGDVGLFDVGAIHAIDYTPNARFVRVTGVDLDKLDRKAYNMERGVVKTIRAESANTA